MVINLMSSFAVERLDIVTSEVPPAVKFLETKSDGLVSYDRPRRGLRNRQGGPRHPINPGWGGVQSVCGDFGL